MATRFYFPAEGSGTPPVSPAFNANWEQTAQANRLNLLNKPQLSVLSTLANTSTRTVPITTTQDILCNQFVSAPLIAQRIIGTVSLVIRALESTIDANAVLSVVVWVVSNDGGTVRGTLFSLFNTDTEFAITAATRVVNAGAVTPLTIQTGDRLVVEIGARATAPLTAQTYTIRQGNSAASDFALTSGLTTDLNTWIEFSHDLFPFVINNFQGVKVGSGMSTVEKAR